MPAIKGRVEIVGTAELRAKLQKLGQAVVEVNRRAAVEAAALVRAEGNRGAPGQHIEMEVVRSDENRAEVLIGPDKDHWYYQFSETGATTHEIKGSPLAFEGRSGLVFISRVKHPGMAAKPFLRPALAGKRDEAQAKAGEVFREGLERVANGS